MLLYMENKIKEKKTLLFSNNVYAIIVTVIDLQLIHQQPVNSEDLCITVEFTLHSFTDLW